MIDYEKIEALVNKARLSQADHLLIEFNFCDNKSQISLFHPTIEDEDNEDSFFDVSSIDEMMKKIDTIFAPKPKYKEGQPVWMMYFCPYAELNKPTEFKTDAHRYTDGIHQYCLIGNGMGLTWTDESRLYPTILALIDAQINYWKSFKIDDLESPYDMKKIPPERIEALKQNDSYKKLFNTEKCEHDFDALKDNPNFSYYEPNYSYFAKGYYTCNKTNGSYCECGTPVDFPHSCVCTKCGECFI